MTDDLGRPLVSQADLQGISETLASIPPGKRAAGLLIADETGVARLHFAAELGHGFKVAAGAGYARKEKKAAGFIGLAWVL